MRVFKEDKTWCRVSKMTPCPICEKPKWCSVSADGEVAICMRIQKGAIKETRNNGYLHRLLGPRPQRPRPVRIFSASPPYPRTDLLPLARHLHNKALQNPTLINRLAADLGLPSRTLWRLRIGWSQWREVFSFPMRDAKGEVIGIRLRSLSGSKYAVRGSRNGLFIPTDQEHTDSLIICEGPTDCAAMLSLGFWCIGRPDCSGGIWHVVQYARKQRSKEVVVLADADEPGHRGAESLASELLRYCPQIRLIQPPNKIKDARAWIVAGADREDVTKKIESSPIRALQIRKES